MANSRSSSAWLHSGSAVTNRLCSGAVPVMSFWTWPREPPARTRRPPLAAEPGRSRRRSAAGEGSCGAGSRRRKGRPAPGQRRSQGHDPVDERVVEREPHDAHPLGRDPEVGDDRCPGMLADGEDAPGAAGHPAHEQALDPPDRRVCCRSAGRWCRRRGSPPAARASGRCWCMNTVRSPRGCASHGAARAGSGGPRRWARDLGAGPRHARPPPRAPQSAQSGRRVQGQAPQQELGRPTRPADAQPTAVEDDWSPVPRHRVRPLRQAGVLETNACRRRRADHPVEEAVPELLPGEALGVAPAVRRVEPGCPGRPRCRPPARPTLCSATSTPVVPGTTVSSAPPRPKATTGVPHAWASTGTIPKSSSAGKTTTSAGRYRRGARRRRVDDEPHVGGELGGQGPQRALLRARRRQRPAGDSRWQARMARSRRL